MKGCSEKNRKSFVSLKTWLLRLKITTMQRLDSRMVMDKDDFGDGEDKTEKLFQGTV